MTKEEAKQKVAELVNKYQGLSQSQIRASSEATTKQGFIEPLFRALGWDFDDTDEVTPEERASNGRVDYAFKLHGVSQFYLEAKPLRADLSKSEYIKQAVTYAFNRGVTWAILTDFESLQLYNAQTARPFISLICAKYLTEFEDLWLLSKESLTANSLNERAEKYGALPTRLRIEERLYSQLRQWREELYSQIHRYNHLSYDQTDETIQKLFNRLIFIRTCEDRRIEEKILLATLHDWISNSRKGELIERLQQVFLDFDGYYDSDLFSPHLADRLFIEGQSLENIINGLYDIPKAMASYDFSLIDADVLGAVYEQYLGHVAAVVKQKAKEIQARMDLGLPSEPTFELTAKKERRKEHGIYYTPKFVTDYIVKETVGQFLKGRNLNEIRNIKILDPACGSGSFLIRAFDELLKYYASQKISKSENDIDAADRISILTSNIFGVDLDKQAVEIARLNLLLRSLAKRETLPSLADNIRQGNSLISGPEDELKGYFGKNWRDKRPFNWEQEFKDIMAQGGFDIVIGNPPYVRIQTLPRDEADYYRAIYESAFGSFDIYVLFIEQAIKLLKPNGYLGFITSGKFLKADYGRKLQQLIRNTCSIENMVDLSAQQIFGEATTYPTILTLRKRQGDAPLRYISVPEKIDLSKEPLDSIQHIITDQAAITNGIWPPIGTDDAFLRRITQKTKPLGELADRVFQGLITSADKVYILEKTGKPDAGYASIFSRSLDKIAELESALLKSLISGKHIERYVSPNPTQLLLFPYKVNVDTAELIPVDEFSSAYPKCWKYLLENKETLENREHGKMKHERWYGYVYPKNLTLHNRPKFAVPRLVHKLKAVLDSDGAFYLDNVDVGGLILKDSSENLYILALLNSSLLNYYFSRISVAFRGGFRSANRQFLEPLPIRMVDFRDPTEKKVHDDLVALVKKMLLLNERLSPLRDTPCTERDALLKEIEHTDKNIDNLVYDLYGLTEEERKIVEGVS